MGENKEKSRQKAEVEIDFVGGWLLGSRMGILLGDVKIGLTAVAGLGTALALLRMNYGKKTEEFRDLNLKSKT